MKEKIIFNHDLLFKNNIAEISSISLECFYDVKGNDINGHFMITGSYRSHEISLNKEGFEFKVPFTYTFKEDIESDTASVNVKDFTYTIDGDVLSINVEYEAAAEKKDIQVFEEKEEFDRFLREHEVDLDYLTQAESKVEEKEDAVVIEPSTVADIPCEVEDNAKEESENRSATESIINDIDAREDTYITYHIHICDESDSIDSIATKYNITTDIIKSYNSIDQVEAGMKVIIPCPDE